MSIFSRRKTYVNATATRLIEDEKILNSASIGAIAGIYRKQSISRSIIDHINSSFIRQTDHYYYFGRDHGIRGLPSYRLVGPGVTPETFKNYIETNVTNEPITLEYLDLGQPSNLHAAWKFLHEQRSYDEATNTSQYYYDNYVDQNPPAGTTYGPVHVEHIKVFNFTGTDDNYRENPNENLLETAPNARAVPYAPADNIYKDTPIFYGISYTPFAIVYLVYQKTVDNGTDPPTVTYERFSEQIPLPSVNEDSAYYNYKYTVDSTGAITYGQYEYQSGGIPELDTSESTTEKVQSDFYPVTPFVTDGVFKADDSLKGTVEYENDRRLLRKLNIDYGEMGARIAENPDFNQIREASIFYGINIENADEGSVRYLCNFARWLAELVDNASPTIVRDYTGFFSFYTAKGALEIEEGAFNYNLVWDSLQENSSTGLIKPNAEVGDCLVEDAGTPFEITYAQYPASTTSYNESDVPDTITVPVESKSKVFKIQTSSNSFSAYEFRGLQIKIKIGGKYERININDEDARFIIPFHRGIAKEAIKGSKREETYSKAIHLFVSASKTVKLKWYQTGAFRILLVVVAIVIVIASFGQLAGIVQSIYASVASIIGAGITAAIITAIILIGIQEFISFVFSMVASALGADATLILAVLALIYGVYAGDFSQIANFVGLNLIDASANQYHIDAAELIAETGEFELYAQERLDEVQELLDDLIPDFQTKLFGSLLTLEPAFIPSESPSSYLDRTTTVSYITELLYKSVENYVDVNLDLNSVK